MADTAIFEIIRTVTVSITHCLTLFILINCDKKRKKLTGIALAILLLFMAAAGVAIIAAAPSAFVLVSRTAYMMLFAMGIAFCLLSTGSSLTERLFVYIMYVAVFMLSVGYANMLATLFSPAHLAAAQLAIRTVISAFIIVLLKTFLRDSLYRFIDGLSVHGVAVTMFSWIIGLCVLEYAIFAYFFVDSIALNAVILVILTLLIVSVFAIAHRIVQLTEREIEAEKAEGRQRLLESELEAERSFVETAKAIRHDQRHHDRVVLEYLNEGKIDEAKRYLGAHDEAVVSESLASWCSNPLLNAQLRVAWRAAAAHGIAFTADIELPEDIGISDIDFVSVVGNLIENAMQAATETTSPSVTVEVRAFNGKLLLEIRNTFDENRMKAEGTGLESVRRILSRYEGMMISEPHDGLYVSRVIIPLTYRH